MMQKQLLLAVLSVCAFLEQINADAAVVWPQPESFYGAVNSATNQRMIEQPSTNYYGYATPSIMPSVGMPIGIYGQPVYYPSSIVPTYGWQNMLPNQMPSIPAMNLNTPSISMPGWSGFPSPSAIMPFGNNNFNGMPFGFGN